MSNESLPTPVDKGIGDTRNSGITPVPTSNDETLNTTTLPDPTDPVVQFIVQNFDRINAMYTAFTQKHTSQNPLLTNQGPPIIEPWNSDSEEVNPSKPKGNTPIGSDDLNPLNTRNVTTTTPGITNNAKGKNVQNADFYHQPFVFKESERDIRDLVASPFTSRIRDYDMPEGLKVPTNLKTYDGTSDPDDHLTIFMGTMDVHKFPEPVWCRFFHITLCGAARFWYNNLPPGSIDGFHQLRDKFRANFLQQRRFQKTQAEILGIRQRSDETLKDYLVRFGEETLHMIDRSDGMITAAFISGLLPGRLFKDLIARPPATLEELYTQVNGFIRAHEANNENRLRETM